MGDAKFRAAAKFDFAQFGETTLSGSAQFHGVASFDFARFYSHAWFDSAQFQSTATFDFAQFHNQASFNAAQFNADAWFFSALLLATARFDMVRFHADVWFVSARFEGPSHFLEVRSGMPTADKHCRPNFTDTTFTSPANFRWAKFLTHHPVLAGTVLHEETQISADEKYWPRLRRGWPWEPGFWRRAPGEVQDAAEARESCAKLRHNLAKQGLPEEAHFFFRREMRFAGRSAPWPSRPLYWAFGVLSDYGYSVALPAFWLTVIWLAGVAAFWGEATPRCPVPWEHSAANLFAFLSYLRVYYPDCAASLSAGLKAWSGAQTFLSYLMLFFLGLGMRQRFRLR